MRRTSALLMAFLFMGGAGVAMLQLTAAPERVRPAIHWHQDLKAAHAEALQQNKPMLLLITADWCHNSRRLRLQTLGDAELKQKISDDFIAVSLDFERDRKIAKSLDVNSVPCVIVLNPRADLLARIIGFVEPVAFVNILEDAERLQQRLEAQAVANAGDPSES
jgi:thiol:disulfide interchange protein